MVSALALVHQRFSTNTFPTWDLAHPFRMIAHNGEINTLRGNVNWIRARQGAISSPILGEDLDKIWPLIYDGQSDSASFDNALELLVMGGYSIAHAMMMMIPEAWEGHTLMDAEPPRLLRIPRGDDGAVGRAGGDRLHRRPPDRRHARPQRPAAGALHRHRRRPGDHGLGSRRACPIPEEKIVKKWRLQPGKMFLVDLEKGRIIDDKELKDTLACGQALRASGSSASASSSTTSKAERSSPSARGVPLLDRQQAFGYTQEDLKFLMTPMAANGEEPIGSMGNDSPLAVLSDKNKTLYHYFKQLFAQVTNPPIDPIREELVTSLVSFIGPEAEPARHRRDQPADPPRSQPAGARFLRDGEDPPHRALHRGQVQVAASSTSAIPLAWGKAGDRGAAGVACARRPRTRCAPAISILIISDRKRRPRPRRDSGAARAVGDPPAPGRQGPAHLRRPGRRNRLGARSASLRAARRLRRGGGASVPRAGDAAGRSQRPAARGVDGKKAIKNFVKAIGKGLRKVMSKMGISTYMSYTGAQIFEAVGLSRALVDKYFTGTTSNVEGIGVFEVAEEAIRMHRAAFGDDPVLAGALDAGGEYAFRVRGEEHMWTPDAIAKLQHSTRANSYADLQGIRAASSTTSRSGT